MAAVIALNVRRSIVVVSVKSILIEFTNDQFMYRREKLSAGNNGNIYLAGPP
jgi:hypothetical protein